MTISTFTRIAIVIPFCLLLTGCPGELAVTQVLEVEPGAVATFNPVCPSGYVVTDWDYWVDSIFLGAPADSSFSILSEIDGGTAVSFSGRNQSSTRLRVRVTVWCFPASVIQSLARVYTASVAPQIATIPPGHVGSVKSFCPNGYSAIGGGFDASQGQLLPVGSYPLFNSVTAPQPLGDMPDGTAPPPVGWQTDIYNFGSTPGVAKGWPVCGMYSMPVEVQIRSLVLPPATRGVVWAPFPDGSFPLGRGFTGGVSALYQGTARWQDNLYSFDRPPGPEPADGYPRAAGYLAYNVSTSFQVKAVTIAKAAAIYLRGYQAAPAVVKVPVIEFRNAALDHYFVTSIAKEISDLDTGVHAGWVRTGESFNAYGIGSGGPLDRRPVCRFYGNPAAGLDSHFYSASMLECRDTGRKFAGAWLLEADEVFEMNLPDPATGSCPAGNVPVYRVWNNRVDSNHRYTTSTAIRDQMVARGYIAEGYGPQNVTLCAPA